MFWNTRLALDPTTIADAMPSKSKVAKSPVSNKHEFECHKDHGSSWHSQLWVPHCPTKGWRWITNNLPSIGHHVSKEMRFSKDQIAMRCYGFVENLCVCNGSRYCLTAKVSLSQRVLQTQRFTSITTGPNGSGCHHLKLSQH